MDGDGESHHGGRRTIRRKGGKEEKSGDERKGDVGDVRGEKKSKRRKEK